MFRPLKRDVKLLKRIYEYITPVIIIYENIQNNEDDDVHIMVEVLRLIKNMYETACHNILKGNFIQQLFVNMVKLYKYFELNLVNENYVKELWDTIDENDRKFKICTFNDSTEQIEIIDYEFPDVKNKCKTFYEKFKEFLQFMIKSGEQCEILNNFPNKNLLKRKVVYQQAAPIILWYDYVEENFREENENNLFFKINLDTKFCLEHFLEKIINENILKQIMENICIVYLSFGIDLYKNRKNVKDLLQATPNKYELVRENLKFYDGTSQKYVSDIICTIRDVLSNKDDPLNEKYFLFGQILHYLVSTKIAKGDMITQVFLNKENNIEWCGVENRFILKDSEKNLKRKSIIKLASPVFVWIEIVNKLELTEYQEPFYLSINTLRQKIIDYLVNNQDNDDEENSILKEMNSIYDPIDQWFNTDETFHNYPKRFKYSDIFNKLVKHSVIGRKKRRFSYSFIFNYYFKQNTVTDEMEYTGKMFDIFNFCGLFYIFIKYFEYNSTSFYKKVKEITHLITDYIKEEIQNTRENNLDLQNKIIDEMKLVFPKIADQVTDYQTQKIQKTIENNLDLQKNEMKLELPENIYNITNYMIKKILNKDIFCEQKKLFDEMKSVFRKIADRITNYQLKEMKNIDKSEIIDRITNYMVPKLQKTIDILSDQQNKIIDKMKYLLPDCDEFKSSEYKYVPENFHTIYSYVVQSRPNVEISFIDSY